MCVSLTIYLKMLGRNPVRELTAESSSVRENVALCFVDCTSIWIRPSTFLLLIQSEAWKTNKEHSEWLTSYTLRKHCKVKVLTLNAFTASGRWKYLRTRMASQKYRNSVLWSSSTCCWSRSFLWMSSMSACDTLRTLWQSWRVGWASLEWLDETKNK